MCLIGEPNSGKTSLFTPISRLIPARYIAMISKLKDFNKSLTAENTKIIFLEKAHAKLMDPDDWKILTQGGLYGTRPQVQNIKHGSHKMCNVHQLPDGHGLWYSA